MPIPLTRPDEPSAPLLRALRDCPTHYHNLFEGRLSEDLSYCVWCLVLSKEHGAYLSPIDSRTGDCSSFRHDAHPWGINGALLEQMLQRVESELEDSTKRG